MKTPIDDGWGFLRFSFDSLESIKLLYETKSKAKLAHLIKKESQVESQSTRVTR